MVVPKQDEASSAQSSTQLLPCFRDLRDLHTELIWYELRLRMVRLISVSQVGSR